MFVRLEVAARTVHESPGRVRHYVRAGLVRPSHVEGRTMLFGAAEMARLRRIHRLREDLGLDTAGVEVALRLIDEIERLRAELARVQARAAR
jgi:DNA-binding transcriptional MerR regulator